MDYKYICICRKGATKISETKCQKRTSLPVKAAGSDSIVEASWLWRSDADADDEVLHAFLNVHEQGGKAVVTSVRYTQKRRSCFEKPHQTSLRAACRIPAGKFWKITNESVNQ